MYYTYNGNVDIDNNNQEIGEYRANLSMNPEPSMNPNLSMNPKPYHHVNKKYTKMPSMAPHSVCCPMMHPMIQ
ncbi:hypothetical protein [Clostridium pasteurianum]|uniref:Uncharacterized protein n=1 Tax=Clostridium pasteurianum BC1 TaxID=86416 RepID=R4K444_CLOPA|nr:hypothetical protein [Clostridium pasteurianum]AGK97353.1 hypothetical protein Clopa_2490 [Clostridium pasteurianum BC1]